MVRNRLHGAFVKIEFVTNRSIGMHWNQSQVFRWFGFFCPLVVCNGPIVRRRDIVILHKCKINCTGVQEYNQFTDFALFSSRFILKYTEYFHSSAGYFIHGNKIKRFKYALKLAHKGKFRYFFIFVCLSGLLLYRKCATLCY